MDAYDVDGALRVGGASFLDALTNWYIRRSRDRIYDEDRDSVDTLYTVLRAAGADGGAAAAALDRGDLRGGSRASGRCT